MKLGYCEEKNLAKYLNFEMSNKKNTIIVRIEVYKIT